MLNVIKKNSTEIAESLPKEYLVLDVGGSSAPFRRANFIIDIVPFESINFSQQRGTGTPLFTKNTYIQYDICSREPWPFADKQFDYVLCSHVLEDIRDPLWVCSEMIRVSKAGYIEIPSKVFETTFGLEVKKLAGAAHHRWVIDVYENKLRFTFKYFHIHFPFINKNRKHLKQDADEMLLKIEWSDKFEYYENWLNSGKEIFEYYLEEKISEDEKWRMYRKTSPHGYISAWARYLKNTSPTFSKIYRTLFIK